MYLALKRNFYCFNLLEAMSRKSEGSREERRAGRGSGSAMPETLRLKNLTNQQEQTELMIMRSRIEAL